MFANWYVELIFFCLVTFLPVSDDGGQKKSHKESPGQFLGSYVTHRMHNIRLVQ